MWTLIAIATHYVANDVAQGMTSLNRGKTISTCPGMPLLPPQHASISRQWKRTCSAAFGWSTPRLGAWLLQNCDCLGIGNHSSSLLMASHQGASSPQSYRKKKSLVATPGYTRNQATSSCCSEVWALRVTADHRQSFVQGGGAFVQLGGGRPSSRQPRRAVTGSCHINTAQSNAEQSKLISCFSESGYGVWAWSRLAWVGVPSPACCWALHRFLP